jgi:hypothetical protein
MNNELKSCLNRTASRKKKVRFSRFNQIYIIPNRDQLKLLENDPLTFDKEVLIINQEKKGRFTISTIEDNSEKT